MKAYFETTADLLPGAKELTWFEFDSINDLYTFVRGLDYDIGKQRNVFCYAISVNNLESN